MRKVKSLCCVEKENKKMNEYFVCKKKVERIEQNGVQNKIRTV